MRTFAERLTEARKKSGKTQEELAAVVHVARNTISNWEHGRTEPDLETMRQLGKALGTDFLREEEEAETAKTLAGEPIVDTESVSSGSAVPASDSVAEMKSDRPGSTVRKGEPASEMKSESPADPAGAAAKQKTMKSRKWLILALVLVLIAAGLVYVLFLREKPAAEISIEPLKTPVEMYADPDFEDTGYGWDFTFVITNGNDVPFRPDKLTFVYYKGDAIVAKMPTDYTWLRGAMDNDRLTSGDLPMHVNWSMGYIPNFCDHVEAILEGTDENGHSFELSATVEFSQELPAE